MFVYIGELWESYLKIPYAVHLFMYVLDLPLNQLNYLINPVIFGTAIISFVKTTGATHEK